MKLTRLLVLTCLPMIALTAAANEGQGQAKDDNGYLEQYPTQARVEYVFDCMGNLGGVNYTNMYKCVCSIDHIAEHLPFRTYLTMDTYFRGEHAAGERPEILRETEAAEESRAEFAKIKHEAAEKCFIQSVEHKQD